MTISVIYIFIKKIYIKINFSKIIDLYEKMNFSNSKFLFFSHLTKTKSAGSLFHCYPFQCSIIVSFFINMNAKNIVIPFDFPFAILGKIFFIHDFRKQSFLLQNIGIIPIQIRNLSMQLLMVDLRTDPCHCFSIIMMKNIRKCK